MRIAIVTPGFSAHANDWAIPALLNLARTLAQKHEIHVYSQRYPAGGSYQFDGLTHYATGGGQKFGLASIRIWLQTNRAIIKHHKKRPYDLLHAFWADEAGFSAVLAGAKLGLPIVVSLGGGELVRLPDIYYGAQRFLARRFTTRYALQKATVVTAGSNYQLDLCRTHQVPEHKLRLAPLGVDLDHFQPATWKTGEPKGGKPKKQKSLPQSPNLPISQSPKPPISSPALIQAASLTPVKNQTLLLQILSLVRKEIPNIKLNLAGSGPRQNELAKLAYQLNLSQNITWGGHIPYPALSRLYQQSHLYLQTSRHESQGMAVLEAMACGLPVLGTPVGIAKDVACRPAHTSAEVLAAQVVEVLNDMANYPQLSRQARRAVEKEFSLSVTIDNFLKIYETCILMRHKVRYSGGR